VGVLATEGTVLSESYPIEIHKLYADMSVVQQACPMWVPLIESGEHQSEGADYFVKKYLSQLLEQDDQIDTIVLGCTHYPLLLPKIKKELAKTGIRVVAQCDLVAAKLDDYMHRHGEINGSLSRGGTCTYFTTESAEKFRENATLFLRQNIRAQHIELK
jgi:glutamate racemase